MLSLAIASLALFAPSFVAAGADLDYGVEASAILDAAVDFNGEYQMYNPSTGKYAYFYRKEDSMSLGLSDSPASVFLNTVTTSGDSGTDKGQTGVVISDGDSKCASSAWNFEYKGKAKRAYDEFFAPYACALGPYQSRAASTIVDAKQLWQIVDCGSSSTSSSSSDSVEFKGVNFATSVDSGKSDSASDAFDDDDDKSSSASTTNTKTADAAAASKLAAARKHSESVTGKKVKKVVAKATKCARTADWICRHPGYVTDLGHTECQAAHNKCSKRFAKRAHSQLHSDHAFEKRASKAHCVIATDHLDDMITRAASANQVYGWADVWTLRLDVFDATSADQQWVFTKV